MTLFRSVLALLAISLPAVLPLSEPGGFNLAYPEGYRGWIHIRTGLSRTDGGGPVTGIHNIYANAVALQGYRTGVFPQGSVIVFDLINLQTVNGVQKVGTRRLVDVMEKDNGRFAATGGWGYDEFRGDTLERTGTPSGSCAQCHQSRSKHDYVFSALTDTIAVP